MAKSNEYPGEAPTREEVERGRQFARGSRTERGREYPGEVPPKPVAEKYPGETSPYPQGYTPPEGNVVEVDAKGRPTVIETSTGLRQYTPNSTMYKLGYLTSTEYAKLGALADNPVAAAKYLPIKAEQGQTLLIDKNVAERLMGETPRRQFYAMKEMGIIEPGSRFVAEKDGEWTYETERSVKGREKLEKRLVEARKAFTSASHGGETKIPGDLWVKTDELNKIKSDTPVAYNILVNDGYDKYKTEIDKAYATMSAYYDKDKDGYNVAAALLTRDKNVEAAVGLLFAESDVKDIKNKILPGLTIGTGRTYPVREPPAAKDITRYGGVEYGPEYDIPATDRDKALDTAQRRLDELSKPFMAVVDKVGDFLEDYKNRIEKTGEIVSGKIKTELEKAYQHQLKYTEDYSPEQDKPPKSRAEAVETAKQRAANIYKPLASEFNKAQEQAQERLDKLSEMLKAYAEKRKKATNDILAASLRKQQKYTIDILPDIDMPPSSRQEAIETAQARINQLDVATADEIKKAEKEIDDIANRYEQSGDIISDKVQTALENSYEAQAKTRGVSAAPDKPAESRQAAIERAQARANMLFQPFKDIINDMKSNFSKNIEPVQKAADKTGDNIQKILDESYEKQQAFVIPKEAWLAAGTAVIVPEPASTIAGLATLAALTGFAVYSAKQNDIDFSKIREWAKSEAAEYAEKMKGYYFKLQDVIMVDSKGNVASVVDIDPSLQHGEILVPPTLTLKPGEELTPPRLKVKQHGTTLTPSQVTQVQEAIKQYRPEVVFLPTPMVKPEDVTKQRAGLMKAQAAAQEAEREVRTTPKTKTVPIDWNKILDEANEKRRAAETGAAFALIDEAVSQQEITPDVGRHYKDAYNEYLRKKALLEAARKQYVKSLNPMPLRGDVTPAVIDAYSRYLFGTEGQVTPSISNVTQLANNIALQTYTDAITQGKTATQAQQQTRTAVRNALNTAVIEQAITRTQAQTLTRAAVDTAVNTASGVKPIAGVTTVEATAIDKLGRLPFLPRGGGSDKEKREIIASSEGALAWRQGELGGRSVWHVVMYPYKSTDDYLTVMGDKPSNTTLVKGPRSAYETVKLRYGDAPARKVTGDIGLIDFFIEPIGKRKIRIGFKPDPKQETTGDITIGVKRPVITPKPPRITPKQPRLNR